jgi:hypothetical protein
MYQKLSRKNPVVKHLLVRAFPDYRGRKLEAHFTDAVYFDPYGGGGTFSRYYLVDMGTGRGAAYQRPPGGPYADKNAYNVIPIPAGAILMEWVVFQGVDLGVTFHVNGTQENAHVKALTA